MADHEMEDTNSSSSLDALALTASILSPTLFPRHRPAPLQPDEPLMDLKHMPERCIADPRVVNYTPEALRALADKEQDSDSHLPVPALCVCDYTRLPMTTAENKKLFSTNNKLGFNLGFFHQHDELNIDLHAPVSADFSAAEASGICHQVAAKDNASDASISGTEVEDNRRMDRDKSKWAQSLPTFCQDLHPIVRLAQPPTAFTASVLSSSFSVVPSASLSAGRAEVSTPNFAPASSLPITSRSSPYSRPLIPILQSMSELPIPNSMSKRRRAPDWPLPRRRQEAHAPAGPDQLELQQTLRTPAILRVPPTPQYSPAFYRSGYSQRVPVKIGGPSTAPLSPRHTPYSSAPLLTSARLEHPQTPDDKRVSLQGIPRGWVIDQLNKRAGQFWHNPATSDVRILVPVPKARLRKTTEAVQGIKPSSAHSNQPGSSRWPPSPSGVSGVLQAVQSSSRSRRGSMPSADDVVVLAYPLHQDYLNTQSSLFRTILSSVSYHLDPVQGDPRPSSAGSGLAVKGARLLPTHPHEPPAIYLPVPDPSSFSVLVHWLYWGDVDSLESSLNRGLVEWQGVVKNVHYLGLDDNIKRVMGKWWRKWVKTDVGRESARPAPISDDESDEELQSEHEGERASDETEVPLRRASADEHVVSGMLKAL